jgi:hypothetical protein
VVLTNLAKFHAATYAIVEKTGREEFRRKWEVTISEAFDTTKNPMMEQMFDNGVTTCINILKVSLLASLCFRRVVVSFID